MSIPVELTVSLKIPDVTAITARRALQGSMGYGDQLADLTQADWWRLSLEVADEAAALALGHELAEQTNLFVNPNKHIYRCELHATARPRSGAPSDATPVGVLVGFNDEAKSALTLQALQGRLGYGSRVSAVEHGTLWTLLLRETDPARARALAEQLTVSHDRHSGLLVNPHSMWWRILERPTAAGNGQ